MEDVLEVYHRPHDPERPVVCIDEASKQLIGETRTPLPAQPGQPERFDYEYVRHGTANLFLVTEPLAGWRHVEVTERRTAVDFARLLKWLADDLLAAAAVIVLVMDNLNTHTLASLYQAFTPAEARRLAERFEVHHTPKHGSWLNVAEIELSALGRQCLDRRIGDRAALEREVADWQVERNERDVRVHWQFTTKDARIKLHRLYPTAQT
jgi:DDE superfamily endonuclease